MPIDLTTDYLGMQLKNPIVLAPSPLTANINQLKRFAEAGAAAAVLPSVFEDQLEASRARTDYLYECRTDVPSESLSYFNEMEDYNQGPDKYLRYIHAAKESVNIPVIASIGVTMPGEWSSFARSAESAGANAIELNIYFVPTDPLLTSRDVENRYREIVSDVSASVSIPVSVKLGPFFTSLLNFATHLQEDGASGLVLFNRYLEPDVDIESGQIWPRIDLSHRSELRTTLRWIAVMRDQVNLSLAATGGVHGTSDVIKSIMVGADTVMMATSLIERGPSQVATVLDQLTEWMTTKNISSVGSMKGQLSHHRTESSSDRDERGHYLRAIVGFSNRWRAEHSS